MAAYEGDTYDLITTVNASQEDEDSSVIVGLNEVSLESEKMHSFRSACRERDKERVTSLLQIIDIDADHRWKNVLTECFDEVTAKRNEDIATVLVTKSNQRTLMALMMSSHQWSWDSNERRTSPMRQLIQYMPDVAEIVMDRCITVTKCTVYEDDTQMASDEMTFYYELLDDFFSPWYRADDTLDNNPFDETDGHLKHESRVAHRANLIHNHPLMIMVKNDRTRLIMHPLCTKLMEHKWRVGYVYYMATLLIYLLFLTMLTGYVVVNPPSFYVKYHNESVGVIWYEGTKEELIDQFSPAARYFFGNIAGWIILVLVFFCVAKEMLEIKIMKWDYVSWEILLEWPMYLLSLLQVLPVGHIEFTDGITLRQEWQWQCGAVAILLAWFNFLLFIRRVASIGIYVVMFEVILWSTAKFVIVLFMFVVAFTFAFHTLLLNQEPFHTWLTAFQKTYVMTVGEFDFTSIFHSQNYLGTENTPETDGEDAYILTAVFSHKVTKVIFTVFIFIMPIIIMNILIGLAVEDIHQIRQKATYYHLKMQVKLIITAQNVVEGMFLQYAKHLAVTVSFNKFMLTKKPKWWKRFFAVTDFREFQEKVRLIIRQNEDRERAMRNWKDKEDTKSCTSEVLEQDIRELLREHKTIKDRIDRLLQHFEGQLYEV